MGVVEVEDGHQPQHGQAEGCQSQGAVQHLPGELGAPPGGGQAVHQGRCWARGSGRSWARAAPRRTPRSPAPYSTTMPVTISTGCQLNIWALPSKAKPPRQCWHQPLTKATHKKPRPPRRTQKGRKGRSSISATGWQCLGENKTPAQPLPGLSGPAPALACMQTPPGRSQTERGTKHPEGGSPGPAAAWPGKDARAGAGQLGTCRVKLAPAEPGPWAAPHRTAPAYCPSSVPREQQQGPPTGGPGVSCNPRLPQTLRCPPMIH